MNIPKIIHIVSDDNVLELVDLVKGVYSYRYVKSKTKKGELLKLSEVELQKLIKINS